MAVSAGVALAESGARGGDAILGAAIFIIIGSVTVAGPVIGSLIAPAKAATALENAKAWLVEHNSTIMIVLFSVLGATKTGEGLASLLK